MMPETNPSSIHRVRYILALLLGIIVICALVWYIQPDATKPQSGGRHSVDGNTPVPVELVVIYLYLNSKSCKVNCPGIILSCLSD